MKRILVFHIGSLGDTIAIIPALHVLRAHWPLAHLTLLSHEPRENHLVSAEDVLGGSGLIDSFLTYRASRSTFDWKGWVSKFRLLHTLRSQRFDALAYLVAIHAKDKRVDRDLLFFRAAGVSRVIGARNLSEKPFKEGDFFTKEYPKRTDVILACLSADGIGAQIPHDSNFDLHIGSKEEDEFRTWLSIQNDDQGRQWIAIGPGSKMEAKRWPISNFIRVLQRLVEYYNVWPVVFGSGDEAVLGARIVRELGRGFVTSGMLSVRASAVALRRCVLYLGNDTGTMHLAAAVGVPCCAIFSSRDAPGVWYPYGNAHRVFRSRIQCEGCMLEVCIENKKKCLQNIGTEEVYAAAKEILDRSRPIRVVVR